MYFFEFQLVLQVVDNYFQKKWFFKLKLSYICSINIGFFRVFKMLMFIVNF